MGKILHAIAPYLLLAVFAAPASACQFSAPLNLQHIKHATVVVVGSVWNYEIVLDEAARQRRRHFLATYPNMSPETRKWMSRQKIFGSDHARFNIQVQEVLVGRPPGKLTVTWDNSTFAEPAEMSRGPFLIALREMNSKRPPLRGSSATVMPSGEPKSLTVLQTGCAPAFIFSSASAKAKAARAILEKTSK